MSKEIKDASVLFGEKQGWTNSMFGGMPTTHISGSRPTFDVVRQAKRLINSLVGYHSISVFWLAMIGGYILALALGASPWVAALCGVGMGLSSFDPSHRALQRRLVGSAAEIEPDGSGRLLLPITLRQVAGLDKRVVLMGMGAKFEIWNEQRWLENCDVWLAPDDGDASNLEDELKSFPL